MADEDGIQSLLEKADLQEFLDSFIKLGATKISHFVDIDKEMMGNMGLTPLQMKRLDRIFNVLVNKVPSDSSDHSKPRQSYSGFIDQAGPSGINLNPLYHTPAARKDGKQTGVYYKIQIL